MDGNIRGNLRAALAKGALAESSGGGYLLKGASLLHLLSIESSSSDNFRPIADIFFSFLQ